MAFAGDPVLLVKYLKSVVKLVEEYIDDLFEDSWIENIFEDSNEMNMHVSIVRWYRLNRTSCHSAFAIVFLTIVVGFLCAKGFFFRIARRARQSIEETVATRVDQIASRFDDALTVNYKKATWELVNENVGMYALQGRRSTMEDRFTIVDNLEQTCISLYGVFDGHGGDVSIKILPHNTTTYTLHSLHDDDDVCCSSNNN